MKYGLYAMRDMDLDEISPPFLAKNDIIAEKMAWKALKSVSRENLPSSVRLIRLCWIDHETGMIAAENGDTLTVLNQDRNQVRVFSVDDFDE